MNSGVSLQWLWWMMGSLLGAAGLALLIWALWGDRARGRRRCPKCWYDLSATGGLTCPECGRTAKNERRLHRTRRRRSWAALGLLLVALGGASAALPTVRREGWGLVSTPVLVELIPIGGYDGPFGRELMRRLGMTGPRSWGPSTISPEDLVSLAKRLKEGNWLARPISDRWQDSFGRVIKATQRHTFSLWDPPDSKRTAALEKALRSWYDLPPVVTFRTRPRWPEGYRLWVETRERLYWPSPTNLGIEIRRHGESGDPTNIWPNYGFACPEKAAGVGTLTFDLTLYQFRQGDVAPGDGGHIPSVMISQRKLEIPYTIGGSIEEILTGVKSAELDSRIAGIQYEVGPGWVSCGTWSVTGGSAEGIGFGVIMEFYRDGVLIAKERHWWDGSTATGDWDRVRGSERVRLDPPPASPRRVSDAKPGENWTIKIKSDPETALRVIDRAQYWEGEVEIPLIIRSR